MSPIAQLFAVATITVAIIASPLAAYILLGVTALLTLLPFIAQLR